MDTDLVSPFPMYVGDRAPAVVFQFVDANGDPLTSMATWVTTGGYILLYNIETRAVVTGTGTLSINSATAEVTYTWGAADTATAGVYDLLIHLDTTGASRFATFKWMRRLLVRPIPS